MDINDTINELFDTPCNYDFVYKGELISPVDMLEESGWCEKFCGVVDGGRCWYKFFQLLEKRSKKDE